MIGAVAIVGISLVTFGAPEDAAAIAAAADEAAAAGEAAEAGVDAVVAEEAGAVAVEDPEAAQRAANRALWAEREASNPYTWQLFDDNFNNQKYWEYLRGRPY